MDLKNKPESDIINTENIQDSPAAAAEHIPEKDEEFAKAVARANEILGDDEDEAPAEHVPTAFEKKMQAIPDNKWNLYQIIGGVLIGGYTVYALFGGRDSSFSFLTAVILALLLPNQFEKSANRKVYKGRVAMCVTITVGLVAMILYYWVTGGLSNNPPA